MFPALALEQHVAAIAAAASEIDQQGVEADNGGVDEDDIPFAVQIQRLAQAPVESHCQSSAWMRMRGRLCGKEKM